MGERDDMNKRLGRFQPEGAGINKQRVPKIECLLSMYYIQNLDSEEDA
jgi:hypothetical protein